MTCGSGVSSPIAGAFKDISGLRTPASVLTGVRDTPTEKQSQLHFLRATFMYVRLRTEDYMRSFFGYFVIRCQSFQRLSHKTLYSVFITLFLICRIFKAGFMQSMAGFSVYNLLTSCCVSEQHCSCSDDERHRKYTEIHTHSTAQYTQAHIRHRLPLWDSTGCFCLITSIPRRSG